METINDQTHQTRQEIEMSEEKTITIKLTREEAHHVYMNADGWLDAGACEGGLEKDEREALLKLCGQIAKKLWSKK